MDERGFESMNVIPLVDVMLVLLTIVLTTSTFIAVGAIKVELPRASESAPSQAPLNLIIDRSGTIFLGEEPTSLASLESQLASTARETPVMIRADRSIALQSFVEVLDLVKNLGFTAVSLQTEVVP